MQDLYRNKSVTVIGGGLAGLSAAVFLAEKGFKVSLYEASPKFGGRVYSFFDKSGGFRIDNGQHILASWYQNTFEYLKLLGSFDKLVFQKQLEVVFADNNGIKYSLRSAKLPPPLHLAGGIMGYKALELKDKIAIIRLVNSIKKARLAENDLKSINTDKLFELTKQTDKAIDFFWKPFIIAVFNAEPENTSAFMFAEMIKTGFIKKGGSELVLPDGFLIDIFIEPALSYLRSKNSITEANRSIAEISIKDNKVTNVILEDKTEVQSDFYVCAVPFFNLNKLFSENIYNEYFTDINKLNASPIVNIHLKFDKDISSIFIKSFIGMLDSRSQWAFKVTNDQICIVISAAKEIAELDKDEIIEISENELLSCLPELKGYKVIASRVLKEMRATFIPDKDSLNIRPAAKIGIKNLILAGDWTDTGLPATIEGAVKSGKTATETILDLIKP